MKNKEKLVELLKQIIEISDDNIDNLMFDFEDFSYEIEKYLDELNSL
jgi:hypothetical protein